MTAPQWLAELEMLAIRYCSRGVEPDLSALTVSEAWGLYCHLVAVSRSEEHAG